MKRPLRHPAKNPVPAMHKDLQLRTFGTLELWPSATLRAKSSAHARLISLAQNVVRSAGHGDYLAVISERGGKPSIRKLRHIPSTEQLHLRRWKTTQRNAARCQPTPAPASGYRRALGIHQHMTATQPSFRQPERLVLAGWDRYGRPLWLVATAARAWTRMRRAAERAGIAMDAISAFRSYAHQSMIFRRKLQRGQSLSEILRVNTAPGFSEHHSGRAIDIGCPGEPPAETSFEHTPAFGWLCANAARFGFCLSYPPDNPYGIDYEPWHWCWQA